MKLHKSNIHLVDLFSLRERNCSVFCTWTPFLPSTGRTIATGLGLHCAHVREKTTSSSEALTMRERMKSSKDQPDGEEYGEEENGNQDGDCSMPRYFIVFNRSGNSPTMIHCPFEELIGQDCSFC